MKALIAIGLILMSASFSWASADSYSCHPIAGKNVGEIILVGNPITNKYSQISVNGMEQLFRSGITSSVYLYLFDSNSGARTYALEIVNFPENLVRFEMSVYGPDHIVLGSRKISRYLCKVQN